MSSKVSWLTWQDHRRSKELSKAFGAKYVVYEYTKTTLAKYFYAIRDTIKWLFDSKPTILFVQNPSLVLNLLVILFKPLFRYCVISDRHSNFLLYPKSKIRSLRYYIFRLMSFIAIRFSDLTIVTNSFLKYYVELHGGRSAILTDKIPSLISTEIYPMTAKHNIAYICTYSKDEPYLNVIKSVNYLPDNINIYITGNYAQIENVSSILPKNIILTGYLNEQSYINLLMTANVLLVLTNAEYVLVCGGYEALSLEKALITSDTKTLRKYYGNHAIFTTHEPQAIAASILLALLKNKELTCKASFLKERKIGNWLIEFNNVKDMLVKLTNKP